MTLRTVTYNTATHKIVPIEPSDIMLDEAVELGLLVSISKGYRWHQYMSDVWSRMILAAPEYQDKNPDLESRDFYEVMQAYRHEQIDAARKFELVKQWLCNPTYEETTKEIK